MWMWTQSVQCKGQSEVGCGKWVARGESKAVRLRAVLLPAGTDL